jgi:hypothetical protein
MDRNRERKERSPVDKPPVTRLANPAASELAGLGVQYALTIVVFVFAGVWLDGRLHTSPWLTLVGAFVGAGGGMYAMYLRAVAAQRRHDGKDS